MSGSGRRATLTVIRDFRAFLTRNTRRSFSVRTTKFCVADHGRLAPARSGTLSGIGTIRSGVRSSAASAAPAIREERKPVRPRRHNTSLHRTSLQTADDQRRPAGTERGAEAALAKIFLR